MNYMWNWSVFAQESLDGSGTYLNLLLMGLRVTITTALCAWFLALVLGLVVGVLRTLPSKAGQTFASGYVELFRNIPFWCKYSFGTLSCPSSYLKKSADG